MRLLAALAALLGLAAAIAAAPAAAAPPGTLAPGFGAGGTAIASAPPDTQVVPVVGASGQLLVVGATTGGAVVVDRVDATTGAAARTAPTRVPANIGSLTQIRAALADGRLIVAVAGSLETSGSETVELLGFDASGRLDPSFGAGGRAIVTRRAVTDSPIGLTAASAGGLLVGFNDLAPPDRESPTLVSLDPNGRPLDSGTVPMSRLPGGTPADTMSVVALPDGAALLVGSTEDGNGFIARFTPGGAWDTSYGRHGLAMVRPTGIRIDDAILQGPAHLLLSGGRLNAVSRSGTFPGAPVLLRTDLNGTPDRSFGPVGRGVSPSDGELTAVALSGSSIVAEQLDSRVARFSASGRPDVDFGIAGASLPPRRSLGPVDITQEPNVGDGLVLAGDAAITAGQVSVSGHERPALSRVRLTGTGRVQPEARRRALVGPLRGRVAIRVPLSRADRPLRGPVAVPLQPRQIGTDAEVGIAYPPPTIIDARHGAARVIGAGGAAAIVTGAQVALYRSPTVAGLVLVAGGCGRRGSLSLRGPFTVRAGAVTVTNRTRRARLTLDACDRQDPIKVASGRVTVQRRTR